MNTTPTLNPTLVQHASWLDGCHEEMIELLIRLCNTNSGTRNLAGLKQVKTILADEYAGLHGVQEIVDIDPLVNINDQGNVVTEPLGRMLRITKHPNAARQLVLCIHMDTVYGIEHSFQKCQWLDDNRLNGPGVIDAKGGLVVMLYALKALEKSPLAGKVGWTVIINPDEELGSPGSNQILRDAAKKADYGLLFEPSLPDGTLISWRKGIGNFTFVARGRSAHAGRDFDEGRNAVIAISQLMLAIHELNTDPDITLNVGKISGGGALNVVPDLGIGRINVRVRTVEQGEQIVERLAALVAEANGRDGITVEMHGSFTSPPKEMIPGTEHLQALIEKAGDQVGLPVKWKGTGGGSDGNKFAAEGLANIDSLGPSGGEIHSSNEYLMADSLVPRTKLAALVLMALAAEV